MEKTLLWFEIEHDDGSMRLINELMNKLKHRDLKSKFKDTLSS